MCSAPNADFFSGLSCRGVVYFKPWRGKSVRDFIEGFSHFRESIGDYAYYVDFAGVFAAVFPPA
jgi:hypothetical protein